MINLLPPKYLQQFAFEKEELVKYLGIFFVAALIFVVVLSHLSLFLEFRHLGEKERISEENLELLEEKAAGLDQLRAEKDSLEESLARGEEIMLPHINAAERMVELDNIIFDELWVQEFVINEDRFFQLTGHSLEQVIVNDVFDNLEESNKFHPIFVTEVSQEELPLGEYNEEEIYNFSIVGAMDNEAKLTEIGTGNLGGGF